MALSGAFDVAIVGAGPAGSSAAIELADRGFSAALFERESFPRDKVCGEFLSSRVWPELERWGLARELRRNRVEEIRRAALYFDGDRPAEFELPEVAFGVSRRLLDSLLARRAEKAGTKVFFSTEIDEIQGSLENGFALTSKSGGEDFRARVVLAAWGRFSGLDRRLQRPFAARTLGRFFGWKRRYEGASGHLEGRIHLYFFRGGYCGVSRVEAGLVNFAGIVSERALRAAGLGWDRFTKQLIDNHPVLASHLGPLSPAGPILGSPTVFFERHSLLIGDILAIGDAAGIRDPFTGDGQASAIVSGVSAARSVTPYLRGETDSARMKRDYRGRWEGLLGRRFLWDAVMRRAFFSAPLRRLLRPVAPALARRAFLLTRAATAKISQ
jgi:flavin-dependent dehydrogenase